jgi:hypothetical protein
MNPYNSGGKDMKVMTVVMLVLAANVAFARNKDKSFPLTIKVLAADQVKTSKPPAPAPTNVQACAGENVSCTNGQPADDNWTAAQKAVDALRAPDTHNAMVVEINGAQVVLTCTRSGAVLGRYLSSCRILLPGEYHARDAGGGHIEVQGNDGKVIRYEISGTM